MSIARALGHQVMEDLRRGGVEFAAHAPGARDLPLLEALQGWPLAARRFCVDERAAGYLALGWIRGAALRTGELAPAAVVCTSGGAALNLLPAAAEAAEAGLPLVLVTADRPAEEIGRGANQTLDQWAPFKPFCLRQVRVAAGRPMWREELAQALGEVGSRPGPFQVDVELEEPLMAAPAPRPEGEFRPRPDDGSIDMALPRGWRESLRGARRGLVWACDLPRGADRRAARRLAERLGWPLLADAGSGLWAVEMDGVLALRHGEALSPFLEESDFVLQVGKRPVSRRSLALLHRRPGVVVDDHPGRQDPLGCGRARWQLRPAGLLAAWEEEPSAAQEPDRDWIGRLRDAQAQAALRCAEALDGDSTLSEAAVARRVLAHLPAQGGLFAGNSLPVRLLDQWAIGLEHDVPVAANRGVSGIDGQLASALGFQMGLREPAVALLGDLSLLHDLSSLALLAGSCQPLLTVVLHNGGGGIFRLHPDSAEHPWAWASHDLPLAEPARALGIPARRAASLEELDEELEDWRESPGPRLLEVRVPAEDHGARSARRSLAVPAGVPSARRSLAVPRLWLHGFLGHPDDWAETLAALPAGRDILPALPGHGDAPSLVPAMLDEWVDQLLETLPAGPLDVVGYSLGGRLALRLALREPARVRRLVLLGVGPGLSSPRERQRRRELDDLRAAALAADGLDLFLEEWYDQPLFESLRHHPRFAAWRARRLAGDVPALARALAVASPGRQRDLWPRLHGLAMPTLWLAGALDAGYARQARRAAARCPHGRHAVIAGAGHAAHLEQPAILAGRIAAFLAEAAPGEPTST